MSWSRTWLYNLLNFITGHFVTHINAYIVLTRSKFIGKLIAKTFFPRLPRLSSLRRREKQPKISQLQCESNERYKFMFCAIFITKLISMCFAIGSAMNHCKFGYLFLVKVKWSYSVKWTRWNHNDLIKWTFSALLLPMPYFVTLCSDQDRSIAIQFWQHEKHYEWRSTCPLHE